MLADSEATCMNGEDAMDRYEGIALVAVAQRCSSAALVLALLLLCSCCLRGKPEADDGSMLSIAGQWTASTADLEDAPMRLATFKIRCEIEPGFGVGGVTGGVITDANGAEISFELSPCPRDYADVLILFGEEIDGLGRWYSDATIALEPGTRDSDDVLVLGYEEGPPGHIKRIRYVRSG